jgi:flagellar protein FlaJ
MSENFYEKIGRIFGKKQIDRLELFLKEGGFLVSPLKVAGAALVLFLLLTFGSFSLILTIPFIKNVFFRIVFVFLKPIVIYNLTAMQISIFILSAFISLVIVLMGGYVLIKFSADERRNKVEESLPDFLILAAANSRAGMTIDQALWNAAKPEFGLLSKEIQVVAKKSFGGEPFDNAIDHLAESVNSKIVKRTVSLIKQGLASGSQIAVILEKTAQDARQMQIIKKEISASLVMYMIFIVFAASIGTPFLYAVSSKLIFIMESVFRGIPSSSTPNTGFISSLIKPQPPILSTEEFSVFVWVMMILTSFSGAMLIGIIQKGNKTDGLKYFPFMLILAFLLYYLIDYLMGLFIKTIGG